MSEVPIGYWRSIDIPHKTVAIHITEPSDLLRNILAGWAHFMQSNCVSCTTKRIAVSPLHIILTDTDEASLRLIYRDASSLTEWIILRGIDPLSLSVRCVIGLV